MAQNKKDNYQDNEFVKNNEPFKDDLLDRYELAFSWQEKLLKKGHHLVMAVNAEWGMGKSYFARNWECLLLKNDFPVCYIDAFEYDFTDDPFMVISSSIMEVLKHNNSFTEFEEISKYLNTLFRAFKNNTLNSLGSIVEGVTQVSLGAVNTAGNNYLIDGLAKVTGSIVNIFTDSFKEAAKSDVNPVSKLTQADITYHHVVQVFKILLEKKVQELVDDKDKPLIVMVDELDRCKPTFAIEFLEKLKHLFNISNIIFVLFINEGELDKAISHTYGVDGKNYLGKFINLNLMLRDNENNERLIETETYIKSLFKFSTIPTVTSGTDMFDRILTNPLHSLLVSLSRRFSLSLRDINHLYAYCKILDTILSNEYNIAFVIILKVIQWKGKPEYFKQFSNLYDIRLESRLKGSAKHFTLPPLMLDSEETIVNDYLYAFNILINNVNTFYDGIIKDVSFGKNELTGSLKKYNSDERKEMFVLDKIYRASKSLGKLTYHSYFDTLLRFVDLDFRVYNESE